MTAGKARGVREADERTDHRTRGGACDRRLYRCAVDSRLTYDNEKFAWLDPRRLDCVTATYWIALKQRGLRRTRGGRVAGSQSGFMAASPPAR